MAEVGRAGEHRAHILHAQSPSSGAHALDAWFAFRTELLPLLIQSTLKDTAGAGGAALLWMDFRVLTVDDTLHLRLRDHTFLTASGYAGFG